MNPVIPPTNSYKPNSWCCSVLLVLRSTVGGDIEKPLKQPSEPSSHRLASVWSSHVDREKLKRIQRKSRGHNRRSTRAQEFANSFIPTSHPHSIEHCSSFVQNASNRARICLDMAYFSSERVESSFIHNLTLTHAQRTTSQTHERHVAVAPTNSEVAKIVAKKEPLEVTAKRPTLDVTSQEKRRIAHSLGELTTDSGLLQQLVSTASYYKLSLFCLNLVLILDFHHSFIFF